MPNEASGAKLRFVLKAWPGVFILTVALSFLTELVGGWFGFQLENQTAVEIVRNARGKFLAILIVQILIAAPIIEELIFRGLLFRLPAKLTAAKLPRLKTQIAVAGAIQSAVLFSFIHYINMNVSAVTGAFSVDGFRALDNAFIALFFFGLAQCWIYFKTRHIWCAMLNHALFNLTNLIFVLIDISV